MTRTTLIRFLSVSLLILLGTTAAFAQRDGRDPRAAASTNVTYQASDGTALTGYVATPDSGSGPFPAVLMIHEWWGLNQDIAALADALAEEGFVVLAPDAFRGSVAQTPQAARTQVTETPRDQIFGDLDAALDYLKTRPDVNPERIGSVGFCFGGTHSMYLGTRRSDLAAVSTFYGGGPITEADELGQLGRHGPVLGVFGAQDGSIPVSEVEEFEAALESRNADVTVTIYPGVGHAFVGSENYNRGGTAGAAWNQMVAFFKDNL
jgi:carboxymethylenebutenolidase